MLNPYPGGLSSGLSARTSPAEAMRRFMQHVLPKDFVKLRCHGFSSPGRRQQSAAQQVMDEDIGGEVEGILINDNLEVEERYNLQSCQ